MCPSMQKQKDNVILIFLYYNINNESISYFVQQNLAE